MPDNKTFKLQTPIVSIDCEMIIGTDNQKHIGWISIVNYNRHILFDKIIKPKVAVSNYLSHITGLNEFQISWAKELDHYEDEIKKILNNSTVVGHSLDNDF